MGITGLLPLLKSIQKSCSLKRFEGKTLGVDAYGWLHRGVRSCVMELATGKPTPKFVDFAMHRVRMLQHFGVVPFLVFDGDYLPSKASLELDRAQKREQKRQSGFGLLKAGKTSEAYLEFKKSLDVTPEMAYQLIEELKINGIQYIVAPYEADPQMVYLERKGIIDGIISEDSDLLVFGAKCLLTKLDQYGNCIEINKADFSSCKDINLAGWSDAAFRQMAILSGCDYLASIYKMGLKTAYTAIQKHKTVEKVVQMLQFDGKFQVPKDYLESFYQAELTFLHQRVFCPQIMGLVSYTQPIRPIDLDKMPFIGAFVEPAIAQGVARGDLHPMTKLPIVLANTISPTPRSGYRPQNQSIPSSDNRNKGVPINKFFKQRMPLAEINPNYFAPSPSQLRVLERNSGLWIRSQVLQPCPPNRTLSATGERRDRHMDVSESRPAKRPRLCTDQELTPTNKSTELSSSRFFGSQSADSISPLHQKKNGKHGMNQNSDIFSDDSIEEAMLRHPATFDAEKRQNIPQSMPTIQATEIHNNVEKIPYTEAPAMETALVNIENVIPNPTSRVITCSAEKSSAPFKPNAPSINVDVSEKFFNPKNNFNPQICASSISPTPAFSKSRLSKMPVASKPTLSSPHNNASRKRLTPLQRLLVSASCRQMSPDIRNDVASNIFKQDSVQFSSCKEINPSEPQDIIPIKQRKLKSVPASPIMSGIENNISEKITGSEDLIIPDSEDESLSSEN